MAYSMFLEDSEKVDDGRPSTKFSNNENVNCATEIWQTDRRTNQWKAKTHSHIQKLLDNEIVCTTKFVFGFSTDDRKSRRQ